MKKNYLFLAVVVALFSSTEVLAQDKSTKSSETEMTASEVAKKLANPVANIASLPIESDIDFGIGAFNGTRNTISLEPVVPFQLSKDWGLITRLVLPFVQQYNITGVGTKQVGLTDAQVSAFFAPISKSNSPFIYGFGPIFNLPIGTSDMLSTKKWGVGPSAVGLYQNNGWTLGLMMNQVWSFAGDKNRQDISQMFAEPFVGYHWKSGAGLTIIGEYTNEWKTKTDYMTMQASLSGITAIGKQKIRLFVGPRVTLFGPSAMRSKFGWNCGVTLPFLQ